MSDNIFFFSLLFSLFGRGCHDYILLFFFLQTQGAKVKETARKETDKLRRA